MGVSYDPWEFAEMADFLQAEPTLTAEPAPSPAAATPTTAAAEPGASLAPPNSTAATTSPGAANVDLLGGQWASRKFCTKNHSGKLKPKPQYDNTHACDQLSSMHSSFTDWSEGCIIKNSHMFCCIYVMLGKIKADLEQLVQRACSQVQHSSHPPPYHTSAKGRCCIVRSTEIP